MEENTWDDCLSGYSAMSITPDMRKARALIDMADSRIEMIREVTDKPEYSSVIFENYYSSAMEYVQAVAIANGLKIVNHICLGYFLRDMLGKPKFFRIFDRCRRDRNSIVYYGKQLPHDIAMLRIKWLCLFINQMKQIAEAEIGKNK